MSIINGNKITTLMVSAANGDTYGDAERKIFRGIQALVMPNVKNLTTSIPPVSPTSGDTYIVGSAPSGAWTAQANNIAYWALDSQDGVVTTGAWEFYAPLAGWRVYDLATGAVWAYSGTAWQPPNAKMSVTPSVGVVTLNPVLANSFRISVNAAVTSVVISNGAFDGQEITVLWVEDGLGHAVAGFSANIHGATTPDIAASKVSSQRFAWDSTTSIWYALATGVTGM